MVEKISVEIGLEGGDEVDRQLESILDTGQKTFSGLQSAADQLDFSSVSDQFQNVASTIQTAQQAVKAAAGFEQIIQGVKNVEGAFEALGTAATRMATRMTRSLGILGVAARSFGPVGIAVGVLGGAFVKFGNDAAQSLSGLTAEGAKLDLTAQQFDKVSKALTSLGISNDAIIPGLTKLKETLGEFRSVDFSTGLISGDITSTLRNFIAVLEGMPDSVERTKLAMATLGDALGAQVIAGLQTGTISAANFANALAGVTSATQEQIVQAALYEQSINQLNNAWTRFKAEVAAPILTPALQSLVAQFPGITAGIEATKQEFAALGSVIDTVATAGAAVIGALAAPIQLVVAEVQRLASMFAGWNWDPIAAGVQVWNDVTAAIGGAIDAALRLIGLRPSGGTPAPAAAGGGQFAGGGLLGGRGTGTSDSNLAWVSRGEHIMPARAVAQPGVLALLEALRRSGGNLRGVLDGMGRFALGGMVPRMPAFAAGGAVGSMSHVTIQFPGMPSIGGLRASSDVVDQLHRAAALAQVRSGGRKPSRYS